MASLSDRLNMALALPEGQRLAAFSSVFEFGTVVERDSAAALIARAAHSDAALLSCALMAWQWLRPETRSALIGAAGHRMSLLLKDLRLSEAMPRREVGVQIAVHLAAEGHAGLDPGTREEVDAALALAGEWFPDRRVPGAMEAIARAAWRAGPILRAWLEDTSQVGHMGLRTAARQLPEETRRHLCVRWLGIPALRGAGIREVESGAGVALVRDSHLLAQRARLAILRRVGRIERLLPGPDEVGALPAELRRRLPRTLSVCADAYAEESLKRLLRDPDARVRARALIRLGAGAPNRASDEVFQRVALEDSDERVAAMACSKLAGARTDGRRREMLPVMEAMSRSRHARVRWRSGLALRLNDPWQTVDARTEDVWRCPVAARRSANANPNEFTEDLRRRVREGGTHRRVAALRLAARLGLLEQMESEILEGARSDDAHLAATCVGLLGRLPGPAAVREVRLALAHNDPRVRANAVESLSRLRPNAPELNDLTRDGESRVRANAIKHFISHIGPAPAVESALSSMLEDSRAEHRLSGLWVAERLGRTDLASRVATLANADSDERVASRAKRCARRLLVEIARARGGSTPGYQAGVVVEPILKRQSA